MSKIVFFSIPAHGHTNPTIAVVNELVKRGHEVWYYSFYEFQEKIETAGAKFIPCDNYLPELTPDIEKKIGKDFASLIEMAADMAMSLDEKVCRDLKEFQPMVETFSDKYAFVGPSFRVPEVEQIKKKYPLIYISLGTVLNQNRHFYENCIKALADVDCQVIMSVGEKADIPSLGKLPDNFKVYPKVEQLKVLQQTEVFITHCGMNSISESLYFGVPSVLFPLHSEQAMVANRVAELNAGKILSQML